jgi:hypothetical protein
MVAPKKSAAWVRLAEDLENKALGGFSKKS